MSTSDFSFSQVTDIEKRGPRKSFSKPRPRNEQVKVEKCFWGSLTSTETTLEKVKSDVDLFLPEKVAGTIIKTGCFFHLSGFFIDFIRPLRFKIVLVSLEITRFWAFLSIFALYPMKKYFLDFTPNPRFWAFFKKFVLVWKKKKLYRV